MKRLLTGHQAGEVEALQDVESTDEGRACVWGWGAEGVAEEGGEGEGEGGGDGGGLVGE